MSVYCTQSDVEPLVKFIDDDASTDLFTSVLDNADAWVDARLSSNSLSIWTSETRTVNNQSTTVILPEGKPVPLLLKTAAKYYAASDVILSLYNGEDLPTQFDVYFQKAESMLEAYILQQKELLATTELADKNPIKHSKAKTYGQKRGRL